MGNEGAVQFATGIVIIWFAAVCFFFALHPGGVASITSPVGALQWTIAQFQKTQPSNAQASGTAGTAAGTGDATSQAGSLWQ